MKGELQIILELEFSKWKFILKDNVTNYEMCAWGYCVNFFVWQGCSWFKCIYLCNQNGDSTKENATNKKCVKGIAWHEWKLILYECNLCRRCDENVFQTWKTSGLKI
jgi:hypothetical protein